MDLFTGTSGSANHQLASPQGLSLDASSNTLYVADYSNSRIMQILPNSSFGNVVAGGNGAGMTNTQLYYPIRLHFDSSSNSIFIVNYGTNNIVRWVLGAISWTLVAGSPTGASGATPTSLFLPTDVTLDSMGNVYVADKYNHRIQFFLSGQLNGTTIAGATSMPGSAANQLSSPESVVVDSQFNIYVSDMNNQRIQQFLHY